MKRNLLLFVVFSLLLNGCAALGLVSPGPFEVQLCTNSVIHYNSGQKAIDHDITISVDGKEILNKIFQTWDDLGCSYLILTRGNHHILAVSKSAGVRYEKDISITENLAVILTLQVEPDRHASYKLTIFKGQIAFQ